MNNSVNDIDKQIRHTLFLFLDLKKYYSLILIFFIKKTNNFQNKTIDFFFYLIMTMSEMKILFFPFFKKGNDVIHRLTNRQTHSMYVIFKLNNGSILHQKYADFSVGDESTNYQLHLAVPTAGNLGT